MGTPKEDISKSFVRPVANNPREYAVKDLSKLTKAQLLEMRDRQKSILDNKSRLARLPDKGKRIEEFYNKLLAELKQQDEIEQAANLFSELNISSKGTKFVTQLEWTGELKPNLEPGIDIEEEDETNPLKILAQAREKQKIVKIEKPEVSLITQDDLKDIELVRNLNASTSSQSSYSELDPHANYLCAKEDKPSVAKIKFRPYQTTITNVHDPEKEMKRKYKDPENTAATPPLLRHPGAIMLTLHESIEVLLTKDREMKETQQREAELRLAEKAKQLKARDFVAKDMSEFFKTYRVANESSDEDDEDDDKSSDEDQWDSAEEVLDIDAQEEKGGVHFTVEGGEE